MKTADAIRHHGTIRGLAKNLNISTQAIYLWGDVVPKRTAQKLEILTKNVLTVDYSLYNNKK